MTVDVERVPAETRWAIATQAMTGAVVAFEKALLDVVGRETYNGISAQIWAGGGEASKQIADALGVSAENPESVAAAALLVATVTMGPEGDFEIVEATDDRAVARIHGCPWWNRFKELGISDDLCTTGDAAWSNALARAFNPAITVSLTKAMPRGDAYCEWVLELQK